MKVYTKIAVCVVVFLVAAASCFAGSYWKERKYERDREQRCATLLSFAIDKAEKNDLSDQDVMEALISNVYAAYQFCDDPSLSNQLHGLWNTLMTEGESYVGRETALARQLKNISQMLKTEN